MFKYNVKDFKQFTMCVKRHKPIYIEKVDENYPIPTLVGVIYPYVNEKNETILVLCVYDDNGNIEYSDFEKMLINLRFYDDTQVKTFAENYAIELYDSISDQCNLFVLDNLIERTEIITPAPQEEDTEEKAEE